jgi:hypothetical protein
MESEFACWLYRRPELKSEINVFSKAWPRVPGQTFRAAGNGAGSLLMSVATCRNCCSKRQQACILSKSSPVGQSETLGKNSGLRRQRAVANQSWVFGGKTVTLLWGSNEIWTSGCVRLWKGKFARGTTGTLTVTAGRARVVITGWARLKLQTVDWLTNQLTNSVAPEPGGSSPHSQQPANGPYPEPAESTPHPLNQSP